MKSIRLFSSLSILLAFLVSLPSAVRGAHNFPVSIPEQQGVSSDAILALIDQLEQEVDAVHSLMILRHGKLITQGWWAPYDAASPHVMHSLSKSFTSTAIGLAIEEGLLSLNDPVISFFPEETPDDPSWQLKAMRIRDLLTMNTGHRSAPRLFSIESNWVRAFLHSEIEFKPGTHFQYNSAATYMLSAILQKKTGENLVDYLDSRLFQPLGIETPTWDESPDGVNTGGWGLRITTETIAKLGQLYLQNGMWEGKRLISEEWVQLATSKQTSNGSDPENDWDQGYGYQFWRCRHNCYRGDGAFGQFCIVMPEHDAVVAITSGANNMGGIMSAVWETLLPAMEATPLPPNRTASRALQARLAHLRLPLLKGKPNSPLAEKLTQQTFRLQDNSIGLESVRFELRGSVHHIQLTTAQGTESLQLGTDQFLRAQTKRPIPFTKNQPNQIGAHGLWIEPNTYQAKIYLCESPASIIYTITFENGQMTWESQLRHSLFGNRNPERLKSR